MRSKFLSVIVSFLTMSIVISSCLDSDDENYEFSSDATIHAFGIDTIHGKYYKFTIDQLNRVIYNRDSLPVGSDTIIDRILIDTLSVTGWVTSGAPVDTVFNMSDSVDLTPAINNNVGMTFKVHAADAVTTREYTLKINVHLQDPDSLAWTNMQEKGDVFAAAVNEGEQKAVVLGNELWVYASNATAYKTSTDPARYQWSEVAVTGLPEDARLTTAVEFNDALYMVTEGKRVFCSADGATWTEATAFGDNVVLLINGFSDRLGGVVEVEGTRYFKYWNVSLGEVMGSEVPDNFPTESIYTTRAYTGNGVERVVLVGMPQQNEQQVVTWVSFDGTGWAEMAITDYDTYCPAMQNPFIMYYGGLFYCFGGEMDAIYSSVTGLAWSLVSKKFLLPEAFAGKGSCSVIVEPTKDEAVPAAEKRDFIWVVFGGNGTPNEVWRGRLNKLGFEIQ